MARAPDRMTAWVRSQYTLLPQRHALVLYRYEDGDRRGKPTTVHTVGVDKEKGRHEAAVRELAEALAGEDASGGRLVLRAEDADGKELAQLDVGSPRSTREESPSATAPSALVRAGVELVALAGERDADVHTRLTRGYDRLYEILEARHERDAARIAHLEERLAAVPVTAVGGTLIERLIDSVGPMIGPALPALLAMAASSGQSGGGIVAIPPATTRLSRLRSLILTDAELISLARAVCASQEVLTALVTALPSRQAEIEGVLEELISLLEREREST